MVAYNVDDFIISFEQASDALFEWFQNNLLKCNADKCHLLITTNDSISIDVAGLKIDKSNAGKLLGVKYDKKLTFDYHMYDICKKSR